MAYQGKHLKTSKTSRIHDAISSYWLHILLTAEVTIRISEVINAPHHFLNSLELILHTF